MSLMCDIREHNFPDHVMLGHLVAILSWTNHKFKSPEPVVWQPKPPTHCGPLRVTEKSEFLWKEKIVHLLRSISHSPQWEFWMSFRSRQANFPVQGDPCFLVGTPNSKTSAAYSVVKVSSSSLMGFFHMDSFGL